MLLILGWICGCLSGGWVGGWMSVVECALDVCVPR